MLVPRLCSLPDEILVEHIFIHLNHQNLLSSQLSCRRLYNLIQGSLLLSYLIQLEGQRLIHNQASPLNIISLQDRLNLLSQRRRRWQTLTPCQRRIIDIPVNANTILEAARVHEGGIYFTVCKRYPPTARITGLSYVLLPAAEDTSLRRCEIELDPGTFLIDFAVAEAENDLIVCLTGTAIPQAGHSETPHIIKAALFRHSNGHPFEYAPLTHQFDVGLYDRPYDNFPEAQIAVCGERLAVTMLGTTTVFRWKTGAILCQRKNPDMWGIIFLREDVLLIPQLDYGEGLHLYHIREVGEGDSVTVTLTSSLLLPTLKNVLLHRFNRMNVVRQPALTSSPTTRTMRDTPLAFDTDPGSSLLTIDISLTADTTESDCTLVIHSSMLLAFVDARVSMESDPRQFNQVPWIEWGPDRVRMLPHHKYRSQERRYTEGHLPIGSSCGMLYAVHRDPGTLELLDFGWPSLWEPNVNAEPLVPRPPDLKDGDDQAPGGSKAQDINPNNQTPLYNGQEDYLGDGPSSFTDLPKTYIPEVYRPFTKPVTTTLPFVSRTFRVVPELEDWDIFVLNQTSIVGYRGHPGTSLTTAGTLEILFFG